MQCSLNKDHQHLKWQQQKSWISSPDCLVAMDKQQTQYQLIPKWKWKLHHIFRCTSALGRGQLRSKGEGRTTIHFTASDDNAQLLLKLVISVNQLSLYGAVADLIKELPDDQRVPGKLVALDQMEQEIITQPPLAEVQANEERQGDRLQNYEHWFEKKKKTTRRPEAIQIVSWTIILCFSVTEWSEESIFMPRIHITSRWKGKLCKRVDRKRCTIRPCLGHEGLQNTRKIQRWS